MGCSWDRCLSLFHIWDDLVGFLYDTHTVYTTMEIHSLSLVDRTYPMSLLDHYRSMGRICSLATAPECSLHTRLVLCIYLDTHSFGTIEALLRPDPHPFLDSYANRIDFESSALGLFDCRLVEFGQARFVGTGITL
jgi:hypothetical protein